MGPIRAFLKAVERLARNGDISIDDAYRFAKQQFGEVSDLMKLQINRLFKQKQAPGIKKQKEGEVVPFTRKQDTPDQASGLESLKNPFRTGGGLDPLEGMTRTAARVVLGRKGIKIPERTDPIDVFEENFGGDALMDLKNVADELLEKETTGNITESMGKFLDDQGMFDLKINKDAPKGMSDEELIKKLTDDDPAKDIDLPDDVDPRETILPTGDVVSKQLKVMRLAEDIEPGLFEKLTDKQLDIIVKYGDRIDQDLLKKIVLDPDPSNQAAAVATLDEVETMMDKGMSTDEIMNALKSTPRRKQAEGGLSYLMGM